MTTTPAPSGEQFVIEHGEHTAVIVEVGAKVRSYTVGGRDVFVSWGEDEICPVSNQAILLPWPNRLGDGQYTVEGVTYQVPIGEVARNNALHGLVHWTNWVCVQRADDSVTMELKVPATKYWPFQIVVQATYSVSDDGLRCEVTTENVGAKAAPYGVGFHPWLSTNGADLDDCTVRLDASTRITPDERLLPIGKEAVAGDFDLREERSVKGLDLDDAWTDTIRDADGLSWCVLGCPDGRKPAVWMDESIEAWQVCTADRIPAHFRFGLAAEPQTCWANAFNTGDNLIWIAPGESHTVRWGATLL
ncbi:MAG: aldose 1-epimerase family protein [Cellulomonadaceae bacterium]|jgi:aldose 1-epimerase|nr:aldose 1-epimerase family protein [Cellulomonadaceae bacterium]